MLFMEELCQNFESSDLIKDVVTVLDNLQIKTSDKIVIYNFDLIKYLS